MAPQQQRNTASALPCIDDDPHSRLTIAARTGTRRAKTVSVRPPLALSRSESA
jgi:hypothetical protein